jgi:membrane-associated protease RseP (regulator of RpoE activity)
MAIEVQPAGSAFSRFMASSRGRLVRVAFGASLLGAGLFVISPPIGLAVGAFGLLPIASGTLNLCPVAPFWGGHFLGARYCSVRPKQQ